MRPSQPRVSMGRLLLQSMGAIDTRRRQAYNPLTRIATKLHTPISPEWVISRLEP